MESENNYKDLDENFILNSKINEIKPNMKRAKLAQLFICLVMILDIISVFSSYLQYALLKSFQNNEKVTEQMMDSNDMREQVIGILYLIVFFISAVVFLRWFKRAYYNLSVRTECKHSQGWAIGAWFVPIITLFYPYQIMKEMWEKTSDLIRIRLKDSYYEEKGESIIGLWWTLWIISSFIGNYILKTSFKAETINDYLNGTIADMVISVLGVPLAIFTVMLIKSYSLKEEKLSELERKEHSEVV